MNSLLLGGAVSVAWSLDLVLGEPPARWHPVVGMGRLLAAFGAPWPEATKGQAFCRGTAVWLLGASFCGCLAYAVTLLCDALSAGSPAWGHTALAVSLMGIALKPLFAWRMLRDEVYAVEVSLCESLSEGQFRLSRLVSRDTHSLKDYEVRESLLETLSENLNDSLIAPLFWFLVAGLPGAAIYRFSNTADAMWGYRGRWEYAGKFAARVDDVLSWLPARITATLLAMVRGRWLTGLADNARKTPSPNSGWPMAALALAVAVRLSKPGVYVLNPEGKLVTSRDVGEALRLCSQTAWLAVSALILVYVLRALLGASA